LIEMDSATKGRVDAMWSSLGLGPRERSDRWHTNDS
jgi:hypothetical protein